MAACRTHGSVLGSFGLIRAHLGTFIVWQDPEGLLQNRWLAVVTMLTMIPIMEEDSRSVYLYFQRLTKYDPQRRLHVRQLQLEPARGPPSSLRLESGSVLRLEPVALHRAVLIGQIDKSI